MQILFREVIRKQKPYEVISFTLCLAVYPVLYLKAVLGTASILFHLTFVHRAKIVLEAYFFWILLYSSLTPLLMMFNLFGIFLPSVQILSWWANSYSFLFRKTFFWSMLIIPTPEHVINHTHPVLLKVFLRHLPAEISTIFKEIGVIIRGMKQVLIWNT